MASWVVRSGFAATGQMCHGVCCLLSVSVSLSAFPLEFPLELEPPACSLLFYILKSKSQH